MPKTNPHPRKQQHQGGVVEKFVGFGVEVVPQNEEFSDIFTQTTSFIRKLSFFEVYLLVLK